MFDRVRVLVRADLGRGDPALLEPTLDRIQHLHELAIELGEPYLNLSVSLKRDPPAAKHIHQISDKELRTLGILCRNPDKLHPTSPSLVVDSLC
jgi:hypothetical protein